MEKMLVVVVLLLVARVNSVTVEISTHWAGGFQVSVTMPIECNLDGWKLHLIFSEDVASIDIWEAKSQKLSPREYVLTNMEFNGVKHPGDILKFSFTGHAAGDISPTVSAYLENCGTLPPGVTTTPAPPTTPFHTGGGTPTKNYADALGKSILFYDAQRSGKLPPDNPIHWRGDSALNDCVVGGWYDAGDHVKFGFPLASTTHLLLWGLRIFKDGYIKAGQLDMMYDMIKWPLDYMLKAWNPSTKEFVVQIGEGYPDHHFWGRPEDMTMDRPCFKIGPGKPGTDVAAETAASFALAYMIFKEKGDTSYANQLLAAAESIFDFANSEKGIYSSSVPQAGAFYSSSAYIDELCEGGMWLYRATGNAKYLEIAKANVETAWAWALGWDDKKIVCQFLLWEETKDASYKEAVVGYFDAWTGGQVSYTPCGLAWRDQWGANRYAGNTAFLALAAAEAGLTPLKLRKWAIEQINFILGDNHQDGGCFSFQIGYGSKYPRSPHHRGASCPDIPQPCSEANLHSSEPSPHVLVGAIVGGPDLAGKYEDNREDYVKNEVAIDYNSGFQSALAGIVHLQVTGDFPPTSNKCPCTERN
ncbi:uncharacterized protein LOC112556357 [Pomacea canaliculata]|uniref:uncharacterized protein LOC112556357 n=1 Tax=Pomacea canaliculata TaxID=400727 RepID=UPI000D72877F|nr:uncharacterized protein LOC112556357 [Pomacea canaliculata]XP_025081070.1 uncharacterized protein LOC112556357 [Pomacea canaliculata]XP_025081072.1 uncharacterized protein LOC112556357 [Pomacea canaliculata]